MAVNPVVHNAAAASAPQSVAGNSANDLQNNFLTLLIAQLKNQDPTNPMDNSQLTSQLAQISTVSGIEKLNTTLGAISGQLHESQGLQTSALIGHGVMFPGSVILTGNESTTPFGIELFQPADKVTVTISDQNGQVVHTLELGKLKAGVHTFTWNGKVDGEERVPDGAYTFAITASNGSTQLAAQPLHFGTVNGITRSNGMSLLNLGNYGTISLDEVRQII